MDELRIRLDEMKDQAIELQEEVAAALESGDQQRQVATSRRVEAFGRLFNELLAQVPAEERAHVERGVGRRVTDLRRAAAQLEHHDSGSYVPTASDAGRPFVEQRTPGRSLEDFSNVPHGHGQLAVGRDVEAWCSKCDGMHEHRIVAMMGHEPKQVLCLACQTRHSYRTGPSTRGARKTPASTKRAQTPSDVEAGRRRGAQEALAKELAAAADPRWFDPKQRYKAGEIIFHPEHGRGKIENVLRSSMLVRFRDGIRPLNLF